MSFWFSRFWHVAFVTLTLGFLTIPSSLGAGPPAPWNLPHFSMDPKSLYSAASGPAAPAGTDILVLDEENTYSYDADGRLTHTAYMVYKVLAQKGIEGSDYISVGWEPWHEPRPTIKARVITPDGVVHELDPKTISDAPAREDESKVYSDQRVVRAPLPAIAPGSVVEKEIVLVSQPSVPGSGAVGIMAFGRTAVPVAHCQLTLDAPTSLPLHYVLQQLPGLTPRRSEGQGRVKIVFARGPAPPLDETNSYLPMGVVGYPAVLFSAGASWQGVAERYAQIVDGATASPDVKPLVDRLLVGKTSVVEKQQAMLSFLDQEIRYTGIEFGENSLLPHPVAETLAHKYGDCKDKALLLVAMLRAARMPAYLALLNTNRSVGVLPDLPGTGMFNHAIVFVPGNPDQWIDPTDEYARWGQLPLEDQGQLALIVSSGARDLVRTPQSPSQANVLFETREIHLAEYGPVRVVETTEPRGGFEAGYRRDYSDRRDQRMREGLNSYMQSRYLAEKLDRCDWSDASDLSRPFHLTVESDKAKRGFTELDSAVTAIPLENIFALLPAELQRRDDPAGAAGSNRTRTADYLLHEASVMEWRYKIIPPSGFQPQPLPRDVKLSLGPAILTEQFSAGSHGEVDADIRFDTVKRELTVAEASELRNKVAELEASEAILIKFEPLGKALERQGKMREAFQSYRDLIAAQPNDPVHHLQLARALLAAGMGEAARNEARIAIKLDPNSALAEKTLGNILEYDLVGRLFHPGSDFAGAALAFRAAANLDPNDNTIPASLGVLLERDDDGLRYGPGAKMQEAVAEYRKLSPEDLANFGLQKNLADALFYAGEFAEARQYAETLNPEPKTLLVACAAAQNGSEAGIMEAGKRISDDAELKQTYLDAGNMLLELHKYSQAADLWQAGASGQNAARIMALASILRKAKEHQALQFANDPGGVAMKYLLLTMDPNATVAKLDGILSRNARVVLKNTEPEEVAERLKEGLRMRQAWARNGNPWDVEIDFRMQGTEVRGEGSDTTGYCEKLQIPNADPMTVFVVKEDGQYKVLATSDRPAAVGLEALDRVAAGNLEGARALLDWVRDEQPLAGSEDPLSGYAFPRFWAKGREGDSNDIRVAAAALMIQSPPTAAQGVALLEEAKTSGGNDAEKTNLNLALADGYLSLGDHQKRLEACSELARQYPDSDRALLCETWALRELGRFDEAQALARQRLKRLPDDLDAERALQWNAIAQEDYRAAYEAVRKIVDAGKADASDLNQLAWLSLFFARPNGPAIEMALQSAQLDPGDSALLHTLGCLYAEAGKTREAYGVLVQAMDLRDLDAPDSAFWYAFGRIAEQYGEREIALADYARVTKPKEASSIPESCYRLAQNRLKVLEAAAPQRGTALRAGR